MKKTILTLLVMVGSLMSQAQLIATPTTNIIGIEVGLNSIDDTRQEVGFLNSNVTIPQKVTDEYYIVHYVGLGYSFSSVNLEETNDDAYVFSYGVGIPSPKDFKGGRLYLYFINDYHYRPNIVVEDPNDRDLHKMRMRIAYRTNKFELTVTNNPFKNWTIFGMGYSLTRK
mgnify:CR=1 FL=1|tara:strand:+ start:876 stop:1385 length:510 start_codon:yes stop_codon:yes gene_type:complete